MIVKGIIGKKLGQTRRFTKSGKQIPVSFIEAGPCWITQIKTAKSDGYNAVQLGFGEAKPKNISKPKKGIFKKAGLKKMPRFLLEIEAGENTKDKNGKYKLGQEIRVDEVFSVGDKVRVTGKSKGKGFAGVVKRWGFKGGPRTRGQSDRERSPGSIGQATTPGRVFKGKKMAGRMGGKQVTISGLEVVDIDKEKNLLVVSGLVPGAKGSLLKIYKS